MKMRKWFLALAGMLVSASAQAHVLPISYSNIGSLDNLKHQAAFGIFQTYAVPPRTQVNLASAPYNATCNGVAITGLATISAASPNLQFSTGAFVSGDVGKSIRIAGAGSGGGSLNTTILSVTDGQNIVLNSNASTALAGVSTRVIYGANDTAAILAFKAAFQGTTPVQLNLPGNCTFLPGAGGTSNWYPFRGIGDLIVQGTGTSTSALLNIGNGFAMGGAGQFFDDAHSVRTNTANANDSCVTVKTQPSITISGAAPTISNGTSFTASVSGTTMTVTAVASGTVKVGAVIQIANSGQAYFNTVQAQLTGTGGAPCPDATCNGTTGTYSLRVSNTFTSRTVTTAPASFTASVDAAGVMTVSAIAEGILSVGMGIFSFDGVYGGSGDRLGVGPTTIKSQLTGSAGSTGTYQLDNTSPNGAIGSQVFQGLGQIRLIVNSTTGLASGDTLYISGITGTGNVPGRANGNKWIKVVDSTHIDLFQWTWDGGYTSGGTAGGDRTSLFTVGAPALMTGYTLQSYWGGPYGAPSNHYWFEWPIVQSINSTTHQVCFTQPLTNTYKETWPQYNTGAQFQLDPGGPATLYAIDPTWELRHVYKDFTIENGEGQTGSGGRNVTWNNVLPAGSACMIPSQNEMYSWININAPLCTIEADKLIGTWNISGSSLFKIDIQSSSINLLNVSSSTFTGGLYGAPKKSVIDGINTVDLTAGTIAYGVSDETVCTNCTITGSMGRSGAGETVDTVGQPWSMSGGVITIPNAYSWNACCDKSELQLRYVVPGKYSVWAGSSNPGGGTKTLFGRTLKVNDVTQDLTNTYVHTSEAGGFPTGSWSALGLALVPHPAPMFTGSFLPGSANTALALNGCPAQAPLYSCQNFTYTGSASGTSAGYAPNIWGEVDTFTFTNNVPYTGVSSLTWTLSQFSNMLVLTSGLAVANLPTETINVKLPNSCGSCTRTLNAANPTGSNTQASDSLAMPAAGSLIGGSPGSGPVFSANTPSDSPQVTITLRTNQNLPP